MAKAITDDERLLILGRIINDLNRQRSEAARAGCELLALLLAQAADEARSQRDKIEGELLPE